MSRPSVVTGYLSPYPMVVIVTALEDVANVETRPMMEARAMSLVVAPKPAIMQRVAQQRAAKRPREEAGDAMQLEGGVA